MDKQDFVSLVQDFMDMNLTESALSTPLVELDGWDSLHAVRLLSELEAKTGRTVSIPAFLQANTLNDIHQLAS
ncbi:acyl carrier protein [Enterovibrio paralichthyis]|uniref:acyl carrier protein n=1 Tax=Enterovibrio paralichthyis TaxID=2853805 RepID=UPI001C49167F|nr:acyl carrier protein [Enterovibrio paralichthyis]MBV7298362.1 acyl carrier protein [Enterovibrio paralichthyis]